ncbi:uncharacterized protein [Coffea arabica]|uniref:Retrotransposon gag domain-containing protein n=1 Tax=Coffea arabica TaxID=13443 RepID=A0ABM4WQ15_COFAR
MANANRTLKELAAPDVNHQPLCIEYSTLDVNINFKLKSELIQLLPTYHGLSGEDPHKHQKELHIACATFRPQGVSDDQVKLRAFPFSLKDAAKDWLYDLPSRSITTWNAMKEQFLQKYFLVSRTENIRKEIYDIRQFDGETLYEY